MLIFEAEDNRSRYNRENHHHTFDVVAQNRGNRSVFSYSGSVHLRVAVGVTWQAVTQAKTHTVTHLSRCRSCRALISHTCKPRPMRTNHSAALHPGSPLIGSPRGCGCVMVYAAWLYTFTHTHGLGFLCISVSPSSSIPEILSACVTPLKRIKAASVCARTHTHRHAHIHTHKSTSPCYCITTHAQARASPPPPPPLPCLYHAPWAHAPCRHRGGGATQPATALLRQPRLRWWDLKKKIFKKNKAAKSSRQIYLTEWVLQRQNRWSSIASVRKQIWPRLHLAWIWRCAGVVRHWWINHSVFFMTLFWERLQKIPKLASFCQSEIKALNTPHSNENDRFFSRRTTQIMAVRWWSLQPRDRKPKISKDVIACRLVLWRK